MKWYGSDIDYHYVIFDLLGKSLTEYLVQTSNHTFFPGTVKYLGKQIIDIIEYIHTKGIVHRDIKLDNFMMGKNDPHQVYLIDYGLSKAYINNNKHQDETDNNEPIGTYNYMSINIHNGIKYSRRDDMISIVYILCHLLEGTLPWIYEENYTNIILKKIQFIPKHSSLKKIYYLVSKLRYDELPPYFIYKTHLDKIIDNEDLEWLKKKFYTILT